MATALIAHRGGTDKYPELSLDAAKHSLEAGADYVEMDIRFTKDGHPVISHDKDALKLFGNPADIASLTLEEFRALSYVEDPARHPLTLDELLKSGVSPILFHIKEGGAFLEQILECIRAHGYGDKVVMGVMTREDVAQVKKFDENMKVLAFMPSKGDAKAFIDAGADIVRLWELWVDEAAVREIHEAGRQVWIMAGSVEGHSTGYTAPDRILEWCRMGVEGILINEVEKNRPLVGK